jgi:hypothetical protein
MKCATKCPKQVRTVLAACGGLLCRRVAQRHWHALSGPPRASGSASVLPWPLTSFFWYAGSERLQICVPRLCDIRDEPALSFTDNHNWHHLVLTTKGHGKGMNMFIDGKLEAAHPRGLNCEHEVGGCVGLDKGNSDPSRYVNANGVGGDPIDPAGDMRLCGRQIGGAITNDLAHTGDVDFAQFDPRRYFHGQVAHFAVWDSPLSHHQVNALLKEYRHMYHLPSFKPPDTEWEGMASMAGTSPLRYREALQ